MRTGTKALRRAERKQYNELTQKLSKIRSLFGGLPGLSFGYSTDDGTWELEVACRSAYYQLQFSKVESESLSVCFHSALAFVDKILEGK